MSQSTVLEKRVESPVVIGREQPLGQLQRGLESARKGEGQTFVVTGEAGVGKSRLVRQLKSNASSQGFLTLQGNCFEPDRGLPYAPIIELLRAFTLIRKPDPLTRDTAAPPSPQALRSPAVGSERSREMGALLAPELTVLLPELARPVAKATRKQTLEPESEKRRLFRALAEFFVQLTHTDKGGRRPLLLIIEDLHWSDDTSLEFILYLARQIPNHPIVLVVTARSEEAGANLLHMLAGLERERLSSELGLKGLSVEEVDAMLRAIFEMSRPVRAEFLSAIFDLSEGNPFFIEEILKSLIAAGEIYYTDGGWDRKPLAELHIPRSVHDAVQSRVKDLTPAARELVTLAAVAGRGFDFTLLQELKQMQEPELVRVMKELVGAQLVREESADRFAFRHALTREAIYSTLLLREQKRYHREIAETMERLYASTLDAHVADLAYHFYEAGEWNKAFQYSRRAGENAQSLYAPHEAIDHLTHAVEAAHQAHLSIPPQLLSLRGQARETVGDFDGANADYMEALRTAREGSDRLGEWQSLLQIGFLWAGRDYARTGEYFQSAYELSQQIGERRLIAHSLNRLGNWYANVERPFEAQRYHREALSIFEELGDRPGIAETIDLLGMANNIGANLMQAKGYFEKSVKLFEELDNRQGLVSSLTTMALDSLAYQTDTLPAASKYMEAMRQGEQALKIAREIGQRSAEAYALWVMASCLGPHGEYARALDYAMKSLNIAEEIGHRQWLSATNYVLGGLYFELLAFDQARQYLIRGLDLAHSIGSLFWATNITGVLASLYVTQKKFVDASALIDEIAVRDPMNLTTPQRRVSCARAELALAKDDPALAFEIVDSLIASGTADQAAKGHVIARLEILRGRTLAALGRIDEAEAALRAALTEAEAQSVAAMTWRIHLALGNLFESTHRRPLAKEHFSRAQATVGAIASQLQDAELANNFLQRFARLVPAGQVISSHGLTRRERQVASLIAQGKSNREIADQLVVSERTVETHVGNIFAKLNLTSRSQIAAWAVKTNLNAASDFD